MNIRTKIQIAKKVRHEEPEALDVLKNPRLLDTGVTEERRSSLEASPHLTNNWVEEIHRLWAQGATSTLALARVVCHARRTFVYGEWARLWEPGVMPFSKRKAEMLVAIGKGIGEIDANTCAHLPRGWRTLYLLSKLDREILLREITSGRIHPKLTVIGAKELVAELLGTFKRKAVHSGKVERRLSRFCEFVHQTLDEWTVEERRWTQSRLSSLANTVALDSPASANGGSPNRSASLDLSNFAAFTLSPGNACAVPRVAPHSEYPVPFEFHPSKI